MEGSSRFDRVAMCACAAGLGCAVGVGSVLIWEQLRSRSAERASPGYNDSVLKLKDEIRSLSKEIQELKRIVILKYPAVDVESLNHLKSHRPPSISGASSDEEFFDSKGEELIIPKESSPELQELFTKVDDTIETPGGDRANAYDLLKRHYAEQRKNPEYLWRLSRITYLYGQNLLKSDPESRRRLCFEAKDYAFEALELNKNDADIHKWCAITLGTIGDFVPISEKVKNGSLFKVHLDQALKLKPENPILHHLLARWYFGVADLSWIEKKVAGTFFGEVPQASYEDALKSFLKAEERKTDGGWKENKLFVAKCYIALSDIPSALKCLRDANSIPVVNEDDAMAQKEIEDLLRKHDL